MVMGRPPRPSAATAIAFLALIVALGGTSYAAFNLPARSVGTRQLKNGAVTEQKISKRTLAALHGAAGARGGPGPQGVPGIQGSAGPQGPGATSFATTIPDDGSSHILITIEGLELKGKCAVGTKLEVSLVTSDGGPTLDVSGTTAFHSGSTDTYKQFDAAATGGSTLLLSGSGSIDIGVIARNTAVHSAFSKLDLHAASTNCEAWGMITPSTSG